MHLPQWKKDITNGRKGNETYTRCPRIAWPSGITTRRNDHSLDLNSQRNNKDNVIPWPLGNGPPFCNAAWIIQAAKHLKGRPQGARRKAQGHKTYEKLTSLNNYLLVFYIQ